MQVKGLVVGAAALGMVAFGVQQATAQAAAASATALAQAFGAREQIQQISLSPDGKKVAIVTPYGDHGEALMIADPFAGGTPAVILRTRGDPEQVDGCGWITDSRLTCRISTVNADAYTADHNRVLIGFTRMIALNVDGTGLKSLTASEGARSMELAQNGGSVIDWLGDSTNTGGGSVLMTRRYSEQFTTGSLAASNAMGLGVERVDTATLARKPVEAARPMAFGYLTDGRGTVRVMGVRNGTLDRPGGSYAYLYRKPDSREWSTLSTVQFAQNGAGFTPVAVDPTLNAAYGFDLYDGRQALFRIALDGSNRREMVLSRPDVDVDDLIEIGRQHRVVGASYATEHRQVEYFDPELKAVGASLERALPGRRVDIVDASADEKTLLILASGDTAPGSFYVFDRTTKHLAEVLPVRPELAAIRLGTMKSITYTAADGTKIPAYLTLPAGSDGRHLPAIVMPHGGPGARDEWGFDWWAQFFAARGFAVLQPNFRGSAGYGSSWYQQNGFRSWRVAIGDVNDAGRWLAAQGIADPAKLAIVGWSYGGYAALQASVLDPTLFKAVVAVAPVTDLDALRAESQAFSNHDLVDAFIGHGAHVTEGSPARNAAAIRAPVLMFHGDKDQNVGIAESRLMASRLRDAGRTPQLIEYPGLSHQLADNKARADMLAKTDAFLRQSLGM